MLLHPLTIPEGLTIIQIADLVSQQGLTDREEFLRLAKDREFIVSLGIKAETLEGYLYPDTYKFPRSIQAREVLVAMVEQLRQVVRPDLLARMQELRMTMHEVLTLASVIEKETGSGGERPEISAVFHNRLKKHIPLQSDPTVIYGLPAFDGNLHKKDLSSPSPYNTYRVQGLPPGPIANPGIQAIRATLFPSDSRSLYFVSRNDGTHQFSATLIEHNKAVEKYQKQPFRRASLRERNRMLKKPASSVSHRSDPQRTPEGTSQPSLATALLNGLFEHPRGVFPVVPRRIIEVLARGVFQDRLFRSLLIFILSTRALFPLHL